MRRASPYFYLRYIVECLQPPTAFFSPIAAFNFDRAALGYAVECRKSAPNGLEYRVMKRIGRKYVVITKEGE